MLPLHLLAVWISHKPVQPTDQTEIGYSTSYRPIDNRTATSMRPTLLTIHYQVRNIDGRASCRMSDLTCWKMQGPRAIPCLIVVRQTEALGRVQSSHSPSHLPRNWPHFGWDLAVLAAGGKGDRGDKCGETTTRTRQVETNSEGGAAQHPWLQGKQGGEVPRFIQQSGKSYGCPLRIHSIQSGMEGGRIRKRHEVE